MTGIFNFPYLKLNTILSISEQTYILNAKHDYRQPQTYLLLLVKTGQLLVQTDRQFALNNNELLIVSIDDATTFTATVPNTTALLIIFQATAEHLHLANLCNRTFTNPAPALIDEISQLNAKIAFLRRRKPDMSYDMEIGDFFTILCAQLYTNVTSLLLNLGEMVIKTQLPVTVIPKPITSAATNPTTTAKQQLAYAKSNSGKLYQSLLVNQVIAHMKENLDQPLTITKIAQEFLVGTSNLKRIFKLETNTSMMTYLRNLKMDTAKTWISQHELSYTKIAAQLGFSSIHHFSTAFKNYTGVSPTQYYANLPN